MNNQFDCRTKTRENKFSKQKYDVHFNLNVASNVKNMFV